MCCKQQLHAFAPERVESKPEKRRYRTQQVLSWTMSCPCYTNTAKRFSPIYDYVEWPVMCSRVAASPPIGRDCAKRLHIISEALQPLQDGLADPAGDLGSG